MEVHQQKEQHVPSKEAGKLLGSVGPLKQLGEGGLWG